MTRAKTDCCCPRLKLYVLSISARDNGHIYMDRKEVGLVAVVIAVVLVAAEAAVVAVVTIVVAAVAASVVIGRIVVAVFAVSS